MTESAGFGLKKIFSRRPPETVHRNPYRDWFVIIAVFTSLTLVMLLASAVFYTLVSRGSLFIVKPADAEQSIILDRQALKNVSNYYSEKESALEKLKAEPQNLVDPAL